MKRKNIIGLLAIVAVVVVAMFAGCVEKPPSTLMVTPTPTSPTELSLGESAMVNNISITVVKYEFADSFIDGSNRTHFPYESMKFLWIYVKVTNTGEVTQNIPRSSDVSVYYKDTFFHRSGGVYYYSESKEREMYSPTMVGGFGLLYLGGHEEGWIVYEVPKDLDISQTTIRVGFKGGKTTRWRLID